MITKRVEIEVSGKVQGVFFRDGLRQKAEELGLTGWVQNEPSGSVRVVAEGDELGLQKLIEWSRLGTEQARVEKIKVEWGEAKGEFKEFSIR